MENVSTVPSGNKNWTKLWLGSFIVLVVAMIVVGGITRLTKSGLSIVEWKPVQGIVPPITDTDWHHQFELYKVSPEFQQVNSHFTIEDYKQIFIWEYLHRVLGRLIFFWALLPGIYFWRKKQVSGGFVIGLSLLVAAQGLIGWLMVKSGLNHEPQVSPFMLVLHFLSAQTVLLTAYWRFLKFRAPIDVSQAPARFFGLLRWIAPLLLIQLIYGGLTSGFKAGFSFNTFPLMGGQFFPPGGLMIDPAWQNFLFNPAAIQFVHRWLGTTLLLLCLFLLHSAWSQKQATPGFKALRGPSMHLAGVACVQVGLGILNILLVVPISLAVIHQFVATLLILAYCNLRWRIRRF